MQKTVPWASLPSRNDLLKFSQRLNHVSFHTRNLQYGKYVVFVLKAVRLNLVKLSTFEPVFSGHEWMVIQVRNGDR